jgi:hypothetical protein
MVKRFVSTSAKNFAKENSVIFGLSFKAKTNIFSLTDRKISNVSVHEFNRILNRVTNSGGPGMYE